MSLRNALMVYKDGDSHRVALYRVNGVSDSDTVDVAEHFQKVTDLCAIQLTSERPGCVVVATVAGTIVTFNGTELNSDAVTLLVAGVAS